MIDFGFQISDWHTDGGTRMAQITQMDANDFKIHLFRHPVLPYFSYFCADNVVETRHALSPPRVNERVRHHLDLERCVKIRENTDGTDKTDLYGFKYH